MENFEEIEQEDYLPPRPSSKRKYVLMGVIAVVIIVFGGVLIFVFQGAEWIQDIKSKLLTGEDERRIEQKERGEFVEIGEGYDAISLGPNIGGKLSFNLLNNGKEFILYDGEEIGKKYDRAIAPFDVGGNLAFWVEQDEQTFIVYKGKEIWKEYAEFHERGAFGIGSNIVLHDRKDNRRFIVADEEIIEIDYDDIPEDGSLLQAIVIKLTFTVTKDDRDYIFYHGQLLGGEYDSVSYPIEIDGKIAYWAKINGKNLVVYDGKEFGKEYDKVFNPKNLGDKLMFTAYTGQAEYIIHDGVEYGGEYDRINSVLMKVINGKFTTEVQKDNKTFLIHGNEELGKEYDRTLGFFDIGGKVAYVATKDTKSYVVYGGQVIWVGNAWGNSANVVWESVDWIYDIAGKPALHVTEYIPEGRKTTEYFLIDDQKVGGTYESVMAGGHAAKEINGKIAFSAKKDGKTFIVYDGKELGKEYDRASSAFNFEGKLAFFATKDKKSFIVVQK